MGIRQDDWQMSDVDAVNCFPAPVIMGLHGHCLGLPPEVGKLFDMNARHQAFREVLLRFAEQAWLHEVDPAERLTYERMLRSLQKGALVWEAEAIYGLAAAACELAGGVQHFAIAAMAYVTSVAQHQLHTCT
jgi:hypothetical protein